MAQHTLQETLWCLGRPRKLRLKITKARERDCTCFRLTARAGSSDWVLFKSVLLPAAVWDRETSRDASAFLVDRDQSEERCLRMDVLNELEFAITSGGR